MTTAVDQSQHLLKSYVMELLYRKDYSTESRPKLFALGSLLGGIYHHKKLSESKMSMIVEKKRV